MTMLAPVVDGSTMTFSFSFLDENGDAINATGGTVAVVLTDLQGNTYSKSGSLSGTPTVAPQASVTYQAADYSGLTVPNKLYGKATLTVGTTVYVEDEWIQPVKASQYPLANGALATYSEYSAYAGDTDQTRRAVIEDLLVASTKWIERECGREFISSTRTETYDGNGSEHIWLRAYPITSITSVKLLDDAGDVAYTYAATEYRYDARTGRLSLTGARDTLGGGYSYGKWGDSGYREFPARGIGRSPVFPEGSGNIQVVYVGGYTAATLPDDLRLHCLDITQDRMDARTLSGALGSESFPDYSYTLRDGSEIAARHRSILSHYKTVAVAL